MEKRCQDCRHYHDYQNSEHSIKVCTHGDVFKIFNRRMCIYSRYEKDHPCGREGKLFESNIIIREPLK